MPLLLLNVCPCLKSLQLLSTTVCWQARGRDAAAEYDDETDDEAFTDAEPPLEEDVLDETLDHEEL